MCTRFLLSSYHHKYLEAKKVDYCNIKQEQNSTQLLEAMLLTAWTNEIA